MAPRGPLDLVLEVAGVLDALEIPYALGGSLASSLLGEPRSTTDIDVAVVLRSTQLDGLLAAVDARYYVPLEAAREAARSSGSFNLLDLDSTLKVDLFVLGDGLLDRRQIDRRIAVEIPGLPRPIWVTSAEDQVLRKLDWFRAGEGSSDRQWRDVLGILRVHGDRLDLADLRRAAGEVQLLELLERALGDAEMA